MSWETHHLGDYIQIKKGKSITKNTFKHGVYPVILGGREPAYNSLELDGRNINLSGHELRQYSVPDKGKLLIFHTIGIDFRENCLANGIELLHQVLRCNDNRLCFNKSIDVKIFDACCSIFIGKENVPVIEVLPIVVHIHTVTSTRFKGFAEVCADHSLIIPSKQGI